MAIEIESSELRRITNDFSDAQKVGSGGYGDVYKAVYNGEAIAVKLLHATKGIDDKQFMKELRNHMKVQHPNIVRLVGYCNEETKKYIELPDGTSVFGRHIYKVLCFEYMVGRSLDKRLSGISLGDEWRTHYQIIKGTCEGLCYLHNGCESRILHLDLKPANVLLDKSMKPKIADFGLSRIYTASRSHIKVDSVSGTTKYMPPELIHGSEMSDKTDVYGLGVTIIEVIRGSSGFEIYHDSGDTNFVEDVCAYWRKRDSTTNLYQVETCTKIAVRCLNHDRRKRPTIKEIVENLNGMETQGLSKDLHALTVNSYLPAPDKISTAISGRGALDVVIVYAFDCTDSTPAWYTVDNGIFWLVQEKLTHFPDSCMGYIYVDMTPNTYTSDMKVVDPNETKETGYTGFAWRRITCTKNMASGLAEAHKMISNRGHHNGIILFFSDGLINKGDFFDGTENFVSKVPVHTFTLAGDANNHVLHSIATNSPGGKFHTNPVPERPNLSISFSKLLDSLLDGVPEDDVKPLRSISSGREPLDVVIVYAFDCTDSTPAWYTVDKGIFWLVQEKLINLCDSCMGYIYVMSTPNTYTSDMKVVDPNETKETGYTGFAWRRMTCSKNMASGLAEAQKMISNRGHHNGIILFFSDGLINKGDFFDGTENFVSKVPVHTFTLGGDAYNHVLHSIATNSPGGMFHTSPVPERPNLSTSFSKLLDSLLGVTPKDDGKPFCSISGREPLDVVIVYAFDCTDTTPAWYTVDNGIFWLVQEKLTNLPDSCMGYIYVMSTPNTYTSDMKVVDSTETKETGYTGFAWRRMTCSKNMASGLAEAHKMISNRGHHNGIILFFSDGLMNKGDFFDGTENFVSKVPVHTFTLGGDAYNHVLHSIATNSPGGMFHTRPVPERPNLSTPFSKRLDILLGATPKDDERPLSSISGREPLDVVIVYAFDCTDSTSAWHTVDSGVFWLLQEKLTHFPDSCMGYIYVDMTPNTYTSDIKVVDPNETKETGYTRFAWRRIACSKNMASGLAEAHKMISNRGHHNGIILFFSDGLINKGDFFDGTENFVSKVPVHTFTLGGDEYNHVLHSIAINSPGGMFHTSPVPERPNLSTAFSKLLDRLLGSSPKDDEKPLCSISGREPLDVVIVYAFDCTDSPPAWHTVDSGVFWLVQEKLTHFPDSCMGYIYVDITPNTYTSDMKVVDPAETKKTGYTGFARRRMTCAKNMASGLAEAHKMLNNRGYRNGIILFFSDGLINKGDFFDGTDNFISKVPVHTFTVGGDAYNHGLQAISANSPGGKFNVTPVPERPHLSAPFSKLLDSLLSGTIEDINYQ